MINIFIGYDPRQPIAFQVLAHSIWTNASKPVSITRLQLDKLPITRRGLTEFTYSRFLVPYLSGYRGTSIFMDSDILCRGDVVELVKLAGDPTTPVYVCKNKLRYEWASMMVFNNISCHNLTPEFVQDEKNPLFDFAWAYTVGELPLEWNHLVGYDKPNPNAKLVHFTQGVPVWPETQGCEFTEEWTKKLLVANSTVPFKDLMGNSVHAKPVYERLAREGKLK